MFFHNITNPPRPKARPAHAPFPQCSGDMSSMLWEQTRQRMDEHRAEAYHVVVPREIWHGMGCRRREWGTEIDIRHHQPTTTTRPQSRWNATRQNWGTQNFCPSNCFCSGCQLWRSCVKCGQSSLLRKGHLKNFYITYVDVTTWLQLQPATTGLCMYSIIQL